MLLAIDLVDEAAAKLKMEITSKPTELDEIDRAILKLEMEKLSLKNDTDKASKERLSKLENDLTLLKQKQKELTEQWDREKALMTKIRSIKHEVINNYSLGVRILWLKKYLHIFPYFFIHIFFNVCRLIELTWRWKLLSVSMT